MEPVGSDMTILSLILQADPVVKGVMLLLAFMSVWSWSVAIDKWFLFGDLKNRANDFERMFWSSQMLDFDGRGADKPAGAMARVIAAMSREWRDSERSITSVGQLQMTQERADRLVQAAISRETSRAGKGLAVLATIGASAPFIGLFGTVWGIMNSFTAIAANQQTNLAVVAPGIAEALFATALGLAAAIPAVVFYNKFSGDLDSFAERLENIADEAAARFSRRFNERG
jgi:biopolymer transport protein TolQ